MLFVQNLFTALEQLWANKMRSLLTVLGIIIAVTSTIVVIAWVQGFSGYIINFLQGLGTNSMWVFPERPPGYHMTTQGRAKLTVEEIDEVGKTCAAVSRISPLIVRNVNIKYRDIDIQAECSGCTEDFQHIRNLFVDKGLCFGPIDIDQRRQVIVLGRDLLRKLETDEGIIGQYVTVNRQRFQVIGLLERKGSFFGESQDEKCIMPYTTALKMFPESRDFMAFMAQAEDPSWCRKQKLRSSTRCVGSIIYGWISKTISGSKPRTKFCVSLARSVPLADRSVCDCRGLIAGRRDWHHECHARKCDRAHARNRSAQSGRRAPARHHDAVSD